MPAGALHEVQLRDAMHGHASIERQLRTESQWPLLETCKRSLHFSHSGMSLHPCVGDEFLVT